MMAFCCCGPTTCARIIFENLCDRTVTVTKDSVDYPVTYDIPSGKWRTALLGSGTYSWSVPASSSGHILAESGTVTITCPQSNATVTVPISPGTGYVASTGFASCCQCGVVPETLAMAVTAPARDVYHDATISHGAVPSGLSGLGLPDPGYYSTATFTAPSESGAAEFYYNLYCSGATWILRRVYEDLGGSPFVSTGSYTWGAADSGGCDVNDPMPPVVYDNTCVPLALLSGESLDGDGNECVQIEE